MRTIYVDFTTANDDGKLETLATFTDSQSAVIGERILALDFAGLQCQGLVRGVKDNGAVVVELDIPTFSRWEKG